LRGSQRVGRARDGGDNGDAIRSGRLASRRVRRADAADRDDRDVGRPARLGKERRSRARLSGVRAALVDRADHEPRCPGGGGRDRVADRVHRDAEREVGRDPPGLLDRQAARAELRAVGAHGDGHVQTVVDDELRPAGEARPKRVRAHPELPRRRPGITQVDCVDATNHRRLDGLDRHAEIDQEVETRDVYSITPSVGLLAEAYGFRGIRPARNACRPASTPSRKASAIWAGRCASAIAVFTRQAEAPSSMASAASDGTPSPASTTTGTVASSMMILIWPQYGMPCPEPIGEASGMTVAVPISCRRRASAGSSLMYGRTTNPSSIRIRAASKVPTGSGSRYFGSEMTSSFTQLEPVSSRPSLATRTASSTL